MEICAEFLIPHQHISTAISYQSIAVVLRVSVGHDEAEQPRVDLVQNLQVLLERKSRVRVHFGFVLNDAKELPGKMLTKKKSRELFTLPPF